MASYDEIMAALRRADAAGDTAAATRLAQMARDAKAAPPVEPSADMSLGGRLRDNLIGVDDGRESIGEKLATMLNMGGEALTYGVVGDEAAAGADALIGRGDYDERLDKYRADETRMWQEDPALAVAATVAPAFIPGVGQASLVGRAPGMVGKVALGAATGAAGGGLYGFMEGEGGLDNRTDQAIPAAGLGAGLGAAIPLVGAGVQSVAKGRAARKAVASAAKGAPTSDELRAAGNALYQQVDDAGVQVKPEAFSRARQTITDALRSGTGYDELPGPGSLTPNTSRVMEIMKQADETLAGTPTAALPIKSLDQMRRQAGAAAGNVTNKTDQRAGVEVIRQLDEFVQRLGPDDLAAGDMEALKTALPKAREVWSRMSKSQLIDDAMERSENYLSGSASGVRNQFKNILQNKKLAAQFSPAEKAALRQVTHGSTLDQMINLAGGGLSQLGTIGGGFALGGVPGAMAGTAVAAGTRKLSEAVTMRNAERARAAIASGQLRSPEVLRALENAGGETRKMIEALLFGGSAVATSR